jgi:SAM-dependent methyltransferase
MGSDAARHRAAMPSGSERFLDARSLATDHRRLTAVLSPGMSVLDVGCGSGAITRGIAEAVGPNGTVLGIDINSGLLAQAVANHSGIPNLSFRVADVARLRHRDEFDVVTTARVLQWLADPLAALRKMVAALRPGGQIVVLDYSHTKARWEPEPPHEFRLFYDAFLAWRENVGMDNDIADHLAGMLESLGLLDVRTTEELELTTRGDTDFETRMALWPAVIATRGHQIVADGMIEERDRAAAEAAFTEWLRDAARSQCLYLAAVSATKDGAS